MTIQEEATHPEVTDPGEFTAAWHAWHTRQVARLADRHGFLAITSLRWLTGVSASWDDAVIEVAKRGGHDIVRPRHPDTPLRLQFAGTPAYPPHPRWVVTGRFARFGKPRPTTVGAAAPTRTRPASPP